MRLAAHVGGMMGRHGKAARLGWRRIRGRVAHAGSSVLAGMAWGRSRVGSSCWRASGSVAIAQIGEGAIQHIVHTNLVGFLMRNGSAVGLPNFFEAN